MTTFMSCEISKHDFINTTIAEAFNNGQRSLLSIAILLNNIHIDIIITMILSKNDFHPH